MGELQGTVALAQLGKIANVNAAPLRGGFGATESAGQALADAVLRAVAEAQPVPARPLRAAAVSVELPLCPLPSPEARARTLAKREEHLRQVEGDGVEGEALWAARDDVLCYGDLLGKSEAGLEEALRFSVSALSVGRDWGLLAITHEVFAEYQLWLDEVGPWRHPMAAA